MSITIALVRTDGTIDIEDTLEGLNVKLLQLKEAEARNAHALSEGVHACFDKHVGKTLPMPALCALVLAHLNVSFEEYADQEKAIKSYLRNSPEFKVSKGRNGGVARVCDMPAGK